MDHDHAEGEVGKVDEDNEAEVHRKKSEPDPGAGFAKKNEREIEEFGEESAPGHDADKTFGETQDEVAEGAGAGEGIVEDVGDGGAIDPAGRSKLGPSAKGVAEGEEEGRAGDDVGWEFPGGILFSKTQWFAERNKGGEDEDQSEVGEGGIADEVVLQEEKGEREPEEERGSSAKESCGETERGREGSGEE